MKPSDMIENFISNDKLDIKLIYKEAKIDSSLDIENVDKEIVKNIDIQIKWNSIKLALMEQVSTTESEINKKRADVLKYWKSLKKDKPKKYLDSAEIKLLIAGDEDIITLTDELNKYKNLIHYIDKLLKTLENKHFAIGHYIEFKKATNGFV